MTNSNDSPRIFFPPPLIYVGFFLIAVLIQKIFPLNDSFFDSPVIKIIGGIFAIGGLLINIPGAVQFLRTNNSIRPFRPANSLQTSGIFAKTRNPMYLGMLLFYICLALFFGNWWTIIFIPFLVVIMNKFIISREENYLERAFGGNYLEYKRKVRRWI